MAERIRRRVITRAARVEVSGRLDLRLIAHDFRRFGRVPLDHRVGRRKGVRQNLPVIWIDGTDPVRSTQTGKPRQPVRCLLPSPPPPRFGPFQCLDRRLSGLDKRFRIRRRIDHRNRVQIRPLDDADAILETLSGRLKLDAEPAQNSAADKLEHVIGVARRGKGCRNSKALRRVYELESAAVSSRKRRGPLVLTIEQHIAQWMERARLDAFLSPRKGGNVAIPHGVAPPVRDPRLAAVQKTSVLA